MLQPLRLIVRRTELPGPTPAPARIVVRLPSSVSCIEEAVELVRRHCVTGRRVTPRVAFRLQVALSEAIANAIICGNAEDETKVVLVEAEVDHQVIRLQVSDEGLGFDPALVPDPLAPERLEASCGRGIFLISRLVDDLRYNEQGNVICMTLRLS